MSQTLVAILPVFLVIALGNIFRRTGFLPMEFWAAVNRLTFNVLVPALLISGLSRADLAGTNIGPMLVAVTVPMLGLAGLLWVLRPAMPVSGPAFTSVYQSVIRPNAYIAFAVALSLYGQTGLSAVALALAPTVPLVNLFSTAVLARHGSVPAGGSSIIRQVARNPLVLASLFGIGLQLAGLRLPPIVDETVAIAGQAALPLALLSVGAGLRIKAALAAGRAVLGASALRLLLMPLLTAAVAYAIGLEGMPLFIAILFNGVPAATVSYVMAREMGGDAPLMAGIITVQTALSMLTLPVLLALLA
ncbi:MAG: AEC family transporter [Rhodovibrionaceae bacterium]|nr:AEC family transporter [Rhodovibrionaceae bacterium]